MPKYSYLLFCHLIFWVVFSALFVQQIEGSRRQLRKRPTPINVKTYTCHNTEKILFLGGVFKDSTIKEVKDRIGKEVNRRDDIGTLRYNGKELKDDSTLKDNDISRFARLEEDKPEKPKCSY